jgi:septum formation protein
MRSLSKPIILASQSPRRRQLLQDAGIPFEIRLQDVEENWPPELPVEVVAAYLAEKKAGAMSASLQEGDILLTADSVVILDGKIYNKPEDFEDACRMLRALSGKMHRVITGVCLMSVQKKEVFSEVSNVYFAEMTDAEIEHYVSQYKPYDKAGSYAVQEWVGLCKITRIEGDFYNIMGLPVQAVYARLANW